MTKTARFPAPPAHLTAESKRFWRQIVRDFVLHGHHRAILQAACESMDRMTEARLQIEADGITVEGRFGPRAHPAVAVERDSRVAMLRALRELGLDLEETTNNQRTQAARAQRWR